MTESSNSSSNGGGGGGGNWRTESFRDNIVAKLNGHIVALDVPLRTDARQMEANIYQKARSEHEYLAYIARLIVYIRDKSKTEGANKPAVELSAIDEQNDHDYDCAPTDGNPSNQDAASSLSITEPVHHFTPKTNVSNSTSTNTNVNFSHSLNNQRRPEPNAAQKLGILKTAIATVLQSPGWRCDVATVRPQLQLFGQYVAAQLAQIDDEELLVATQQQVMAVLNKAV